MATLVVVKIHLIECPVFNGFNLIHLFVENLYQLTNYTNYIRKFIQRCTLSPFFPSKSRIVKLLF